MSEKEKGSILEALSDLPEKDKAFILGYAARAAEENKQQEGVVTNGSNADDQTGTDSSGSR